MHSGDCRLASDCRGIALRCQCAPAMWMTRGIENHFLVHLLEFLASQICHPAPFIPTQATYIVRDYSPPVR